MNTFAMYKYITLDYFQYFIVLIQSIHFFFSTQLKVNETHTTKYYVMQTGYNMFMFSHYFSSQNINHYYIIIKFNVILIHILWKLSLMLYVRIFSMKNVLKFNARWIIWWDFFFSSLT